MSNLVKHAEIELKALGMLDSGDEMNELMCKSLLELIHKFAEQGHSGLSAGYCADLFNKLVRFEPLCPLTGDDSEWVEVTEQNGPLYQNIRCSHVFKDDAGAYDINGRVFVDSNGVSYTNVNSHIPITFPYTPKTEYVKDYCQQ